MKQKIWIISYYPRLCPSNLTFQFSFCPTNIRPFGQFHLQNFRPSGEASVHYGQSHLSLFHLFVRLPSVSLYLTFHTVCPSGVRPSVIDDLAFRYSSIRPTTTASSELFLSKKFSISAHVLLFFLFQQTWNFEKLGLKPVVNITHLCMNIHIWICVETKEYW